jgi:exonuclease SbcC
MWHLKSIHANNLCSFLEMDYTLKQGEATLIFGNNLDSDSQNSNGSGKSALIEAIAIALTGEPLRKVNVDEIINDTQDEAAISAVLTNDTLGEQMTINRKLSRKQPQLIQILKQTGEFDNEVEEISQATVADYNKYILDQLGLTKDDIFANFILTARKYKSFLSSSDKEKKEIINRFSNGVLVDESIEELHTDMAPVQEELNKAEKEVATCTGRVEALAGEIEKAINESAERKATNASRIKNWEDAIVAKRSEIRSVSDNIAKVEDSLDSLDALDAAMQKLEKGKSDANEALETINEQFKANDLALTTDYAREIVVLHSQYEQAQKAAEEANQEIKKLQTALEDAEKERDQALKTLNAKFNKNKKDSEDCASSLSKLSTEVRELQKKADDLTAERTSTKSLCMTLSNQLAGVIECPKCKHEFILNSQLDVTDARHKLDTLQEALRQIANKIEENEAKYNKVVADGKKQREAEVTLDDERRALNQESRDIAAKYEAAANKCADCSKKVDQISASLKDVQNKISRIRKRIFDDVFEVIDEAYKRREATIKSYEEDIETLKGSISSFENAIQQAKSASEEDMLISLKESQEQYQKELQTAIQAKNEVEGRLNELQAQEATFVEFKTYLANTKINAISQITNEFLETIGSDIRVALSGYTVLKSGKVRDKISVSLLRDGVDCGSFEKFSAGERVRVELASILSMNQLTNMNCEDGKGLDLLIADEVLDSADEQGLASVFKALNKTQLTSLVVSHGLTNEGYPNKITVVKSNGVSSIYETNHII